MNTKHFANKKLLWTLFLICIVLTVWILIFKLCIKDLFHFENITQFSVAEWFAIGINPAVSLPLFTPNEAALRLYIGEQSINVLATIPLGILASFVMKKRHTFLFSALFIISIELTQLFCQIGGFDVIDFATNMIGVSIGVLIYCLWLGKLSSPTIDKTCKIFVAIFAPITIYAIYSMIFVFPTFLPA